MKNFLKNITGQEGQAMILTVLAIGGAIMGATAIAGLLMLYQINATTDVAHSSQAILAADSGVNWALFDQFCNVTTTASPISRCPGGGEQPLFTFADGATTTITCYDAAGTTTLCSTTSSLTAISIGSSLTSKRAFSLDFSGVSTSLP